MKIANIAQSLMSIKEKAMIKRIKVYTNCYDESFEEYEFQDVLNIYWTSNICNIVCYNCPIWSSGCVYKIEIL